MTMGRLDRARRFCLRRLPEFTLSAFRVPMKGFSSRQIKIFDYGKKVRRIESAEDVAEFMSKWGQISRWLTDDGSRPYSESYLLIEPHLSGIKHFAGYVDTSDKIGFCYSLRDQLLVERANFVIDTKHPEMPLVIETSSLLRFVLLEMWNEFGGEHPAHWGVQNCQYCDHPFQVGGRRGTQSRRADAHYCSDSCRNMASRARTANWR